MLQYSSKTVFHSDRNLQDMHIPSEPRHRLWLIPSRNPLRDNTRRPKHPSEFTHLQRRVRAHASRSKRHALRMGREPERRGFRIRAYQVVSPLSSSLASFFVFTLDDWGDERTEPEISFRLGQRCIQRSGHVHSEHADRSSFYGDEKSAGEALPEIILWRGGLG